MQLAGAGACSLVEVFSCQVHPVLDKYSVGWVGVNWPK